MPLGFARPLVLACHRSARPVLALVALAVGLARIVDGVHLPADVIGGWSFGILTGLGEVEISEQIRAHRDGDTAGD